ncbi:phage holin family protein [Streptomyces sp. NPDC126497]|uniref:phage holin family protein n=1 Tax=Streptomyces sp. NPDC126497 TaxID=3155313 RepID=UPI0033305B7F
MTPPHAEPAVLTPGPGAGRPWLVRVSPSARGSLHFRQHAVRALAVALPVRAAGLIVTAVLGVIAVVLAMSGRKQVEQASPPTPEQAVENVKADMAEIKESTHR